MTSGMGLFYGVRQKPGCCCKQTPPLADRGPITEGFVEGPKLIRGIVDSESATEYPEGFWDQMSTVHLTVRVPTVANRRAAVAAGEGGNIVNIASRLSFKGEISWPQHTG